MLCRVKVNKVWFMDNLQLFAKTEKETEILTVTVDVISKNINMESGTEKCSMMIQ